MNAPEKPRNEADIVAQGMVPVGTVHPGEIIIEHGRVLRPLWPADDYERELYQLAVRDGCRLYRDPGRQSYVFVELNVRVKPMGMIDDRWAKNKWLADHIAKQLWRSVR